jgi:hypothetical protein
MTTKKKTSRSKSQVKRITAQQAKKELPEENAEAIFGKSDEVAENEVEYNEESSTGPSLAPGDANPDFGKPSVATIDELMVLLRDDSEPEDETQWVEFEWDDEQVKFPLRKKYKFRADKTFYRLQLISKPDMLDPATNQIIKGKNLAAQFKNGRYDTRREDVARLIYRSRAFRRGRLEDIDEVNKIAKEKSYQALKSVLTSASDKKRLLRELITELREDAVAE